MSVFATSVDGQWSGTNGFRMHPTDEFTQAPSSAVVRPLAGGVGVGVEYTWRHPVDGEQSGFLLIGEPAEDGVLTAALLDSWHQRTGPATLTGTREPTEHGARAHVEYDYGQGWCWRIVLGPTADGLVMTMWNVVPDGVEGAPAGAYEVMVARWRRQDA